MPTVSAVVATYNRADVLRKCLRELRSQSRTPDEIMVIDDASPDQTRAMVRQEFPDTRYTRMPQNMGQAYNRNLGFMSTGGDYILSIDDDAWFEDSGGLARAVAYMEAHPDVGIIALNVRLPNGWLFLPLDAPVTDVSAYIGCACLMRREVAERALYLSDLRVCNEESDQSVRVYDLGYRIAGLPDVVMFHALSTKNRNWARFRFMQHRNGVIREIARCPLVLLPWRLLSYWGGQTLCNFREGLYLNDLRLLLHLPQVLWIGLRHRAPVRLASYRRWREVTRAEKGVVGLGQGPAHNSGGDW